jgi:hypothetical protein
MRTEIQVGAPALNAAMVEMRLHVLGVGGKSLLPLYDARSGHQANETLEAPQELAMMTMEMLPRCAISLAQ